MSLQTARYNAVARDITRVFRDEAMQSTPFWPLLCLRIPSRSLDEKYSMIGNLPGMREWIGPREFKELRAADYVLANKHWESSLQVQKTDVRDDRLGTLGMRIRQLAREATYHPDELLFANVVNTGEANACYDGQFFFDTDHSWGDSGSQSNDLTYNAVDHTAVTPTEFKAAFHAALIQMLGFKNDQGKPFYRPVVGRLGNLVCCVPLSMLESARQAFEQVVSLEVRGTEYAGTSNWTIERPTIVPVQYMGAGYSNGSDVKFDLYDVGDRSVLPYVFQAREPLRQQVKGADDIEYKEMKVMTEARYNIGYYAWWKAVRTTFN